MESKKYIIDSTVIEAIQMLIEKSIHPNLKFIDVVNIVQALQSLEEVPAKEDKPKKEK